MTEAEEQEAGETIARVLGLTPILGDGIEEYRSPRYETAWGLRSAIGLTRTMKDILKCKDEDDN